MRHALWMLIAAAVLVPAASAAEAAPEITRPPGSTAPQPVGQLHTLRNIPEACVRLQGQFTAGGVTPYTLEAVKREPCAQRAAYLETAGLKRPPSEATGWILNDRIEVKRADAPTCVATIEIWRRPGDAAPPQLDAQGRSRIYLDKPQQQVLLPVFTAVLSVAAKGCN
jgi:hypothetical protein